MKIMRKLKDREIPKPPWHVGWRHTIFIKFFAHMTFNIVFIIVFYIILNTFFHTRYYLKKKENSLLKTYVKIEELCAEHSDSDIALSLEKLSNDYNMQIMITDGKDDVLYSTLPDTAERFKHRPPSDVKEEKAAENGREHPEREVLEKTDRYVIFNMYMPTLDASSLELWGELDGGKRVMLQASVAAIRESVSIANRFWLFCGINATLFALLAAFLISRRMTVRIKDISEVANRMSDMDFSVKYRLRGKDELSLCGESLNKMSEKLEKAVSELKKANLELTRDIDKKERIDRQRREFLSNVSHELKTPISIIEAYAEGLNEMDLDENERRFYTEVIADEAQKMGLLIQKLMSLMRIESGSEPIDIERYDISEQIERIINRKNILTEQSGAVTEFRNEGAVYVWADEFLIEEAFVNYIVNAAKYSGGEKRIKVFTERRGKNVRVCVFNSGAPISDTDAENIWKSFYRKDKARTRESGNYGLGLSIVAAIIEAHEHEYGVYNTDGGVVFWFEVDGE